MADLIGEASVNRVILEQMGNGFCVGQVIDGRNFNCIISKAARKTRRPILPNPLIPILQSLFASFKNEISPCPRGENGHGIS